MNLRPRSALDLSYDGAAFGKRQFAILPRNIPLDLIVTSRVRTEVVAEDGFEFWWFDNTDWVALFGQSFGIIGASWIAFLISNFFDSWFYAWVKKKTGGKYLWLRSVFTDLPSLAIDSAIFVTLAFGLFVPNPDWVQVGNTILGQIVTKWILGAIDTPFIYLDRWIVNYKRKTIENDSK